MAQRQLKRDWNKVKRLPNIALEVTMVTEQVPLVEFVGDRVLFQVIVDTSVRQ